MSGRRCAEGVAGAVPPGWGSPPVDPQTEICTEHPKGEGFGVCNVSVKDTIKKHCFNYSDDLIPVKLEKPRE